MNKNYSYPTTLYERMLAEIYVVLVLYIIFAFYRENFLSKNWKKVFFYQKYVNQGENTFIHCSRLTVVHVYVNVFL